MASERILKLRDLIDNYDELLKYVPIQDIQYTPDPDKNVIYRFADTVIANLDQSQPAHIPGSWIAGNGGYFFRTEAKRDWLLKEDYDDIRDFPKGVSKEAIFCMDNYIYTIAPFMWGHVCVNVQMMLDHGINGMIAMLKQRLQDETLSERQRDFLNTAILEWQAALRYEMRHRDYYRTLAEKESDVQQKSKYEEMAARIERVPANPATNFIDALQSISFMYLCLHAEDVGGHTLGRIDQILYPYYKKDIDEGVITKEEAEEYFFDWWLKFNLSHIILETDSESWALPNTETDHTHNNGLVWTGFTDSITREKHTDDGYVIDIGGVDADGNDGVNDISWLVIKALNELNTLGMKPVFKLNEKTSPEFAKACYETNSKIKYGFPAITFDRNAVRAFRQEPNNKYTEEDLNNIVHIGCVELAVPGKSYTDPMNAFFNFPKILLLTMQGGYLAGNQVGLEMAPAETFDGFYEQYKMQVEHFINEYAETANLACQFFNEKYKRPLVSSVISGCIDKAQLADEGGAYFWHKCMNSSGLGTAIDSLVAIYDVVYDKKLKTMDEFVKILDNDFYGEEAFRLYLVNKLPKYGNGDPMVDGLAKDFVDFYCAAVSKCKTWNGTPYRPGLYSYYGPSVNYGIKPGSTPDGRIQGEPLSLNTDPGHGCIRSGLTGAMKSVTVYDQAKALNASAIDVHLAANTPTEVIKTIAEYLDQHGALYMQCTVADRAEMLDAQVHPEKHKDLVVRVTGFSAHFIALDKETQNEIIARSYWQ